MFLRFRKIKVIISPLQVPTAGITVTYHIIISNNNITSSSSSSINRTWHVQKIRDKKSISSFTLTICNNYQKSKSELISLCKKNEYH